jgi:uncharacterized protein YjdB
MKRKLVYIAILINALVFADAQIVADHTIVSHFDDIPQQYLDSVKHMLVSLPGESHSEGYRRGMSLLEMIDPIYQVQIYDLSTPPDSTDQYLRFGRHIEMGEDYFFSETRIAELKENITSQNSTGNPFHVMGFGWCWDMTNDNDPGGIEDSVYQVHWAGRSIGGPEGNLRWGLDSADQVLTGNSVSMDTYLEAIESYILYCTENSYPTTWIFTTGPVDWPEHAGSENGFQREIKHDYIRAYVAADTSRILFDYADILCWNNNGEQNLTEWNDEDSIRPHAQIHPENMMDYNSSWNMIAHTEDGDHIGEVGTVRLAKAMWWMLARLAGWDGEIPVAHVQLTADNDSTELITGGELQYTATILPEDATNQAVDWSVINGTGSARISSLGLLRGALPGDVEVIAFAQDGSGVGDTLALTITPPLVPVSDITLTTAGGTSEMNAGTTLQCSTTVMPVDATNPAVSWSVVNGTGSASVSSGGLVSALTVGSVELIATAEDGSWVSDTIQLNILASITVTDIDVSSTGGVTQMILGEELQMLVSVLPMDATNPVVAWSVVNGTGSASVSSGGLVSALSVGSVELIATADDGSGVSDSFLLSINSATVLVSEIIIVSNGEVSVIDEGSTLQFTASVLPSNANNQAVAWSVNPGTGTADITQDGLLTAVSKGTIDVVASAQDGSGISSTFAINIMGPDGLFEERESSTIQIYPNPSSGKFYLDAGEQLIERIEVVSAAGVVVGEAVFTPGKRVMELDLSSEEPGTFFILAIGKDQSFIQTLIISR